MSIDVANNLTDQQFQAELSGHLAIIRYRYDDGVLVLTHTEVPDELGGQGVGSQLVRAALDFAKTEDLKIVPECPFIKAYIDKHDEYQSLLASQ
ncbi:MAG: N-acetyltransferase [Desulfuromonas sp.]|nr:MAG: N-acetyltransferase [Desulfuromonas sp.]